MRRIIHQGETRGRFITFEGGEGTGKSTQAAVLADRLRAAGRQVVLTREPGGSPGAEIVRHVLLTGAAKPLGPEVEAVLFAAARADHVESRILPALSDGIWVVCDRFIDSTRVYQGVLGHVDRRLLHALERVAAAEAMPDLTLILDLPSDIGMARAAERRGAEGADRFEGEAAGFHTLLNGAYRALAKQEPERCVLIDAARSKETIADAIWQVVTKRFDIETLALAEQAMA